MKLRRRSCGVTLVELLVSISIGLVVAGAMVGLYIGTARSYRQIEALGQLQSNARYVFEIMGYDIRMAGNMTCPVPGQTRPANFVDNYNATEQWWSNTDRPLFGQDETADNNAKGDSGFPDVAPGAYGPEALRGDTLIVLRANPDDTSAGVVTSYNTKSTAPIIMAAGSFNVGSLLLLTDCKTTASLFQMTGNTGGIQHNIPAGSDRDMAGAKVAPLSANAYYLRNSPYKYTNSNKNIPSLFRQTLGTKSDQVDTTAEELVSGVTDLQILYGVDTSASPSGVIGSYLTATQINAAGYDWSDPKRVLAVRVTITLESADDSVATESRSFTLGNGTVITDRRLRRSYTMTFGIRQRLS